MTKRRVFYSFHYKLDNWRAMNIRNIGALERNQPVEPSEWEEVKQGGDRSIKRWIDEHLQGRSCTIVLVGAETAGRKWIQYEIEKSWNDRKGVFGVHIYNMKDRSESQTRKGRNPFIKLPHYGSDLSSIIRCYDPPSSDSKSVRAYIEENLEYWVEKAIVSRELSR